MPTEAEKKQLGDVKGAYLADLVVELRVADRGEWVVHVNTVYITALDPEEAYRKAMTDGNDYNFEYTTLTGSTAVSRFVGLHQLNEVPRELEDGDELRYTEFEMADANTLVAMKNDLAVFAKPSSPNVMFVDRKILGEVVNSLKNSKNSDRE